MQHGQDDFILGNYTSLVNGTRKSLATVFQSWNVVKGLDPISRVILRHILYEDSEERFSLSMTYPFEISGSLFDRSTQSPSHGRRISRELGSIAGQDIAREGKRWNFVWNTKSVVTDVVTGPILGTTGLCGIGLMDDEVGTLYKGQKVPSSVKLTE